MPRQRFFVEVKGFMSDQHYEKIEYLKRIVKRIQGRLEEKMGKNFSNRLKAMVVIFGWARENGFSANIYLKDGSAKENVEIKESGRIQIKGDIYDDAGGVESVTIKFVDVAEFTVFSHHTSEALDEMEVELPEE